MDYEEKIKEFEEELRKTPYNKRTQGHIGLVKAKIARLKDRIEKKEKGKGKRSGFAVKKTGDATVVLAGFPSVGKSTLLNKLTNAESKVADYAFTTLNIIPGLLKYRNASIQLLDAPGLIKGAAQGKGKGKGVLSIIKLADLLLIMIDINDLRQLKIIEKELYEANIRINKEMPNIRINKTERNGIEIASNSSHLAKETITAILREYKIANACVSINEDVTEDELIDFLEGNRKYVPAIIVLNKEDLASEEQKRKAAKISEAIMISAEKNTNIEKLKEEIFKKLKLIQIFLKQIGKKADLKEPLIMKEGCKIRNVCEKLHRDFINKFRFARVWGNSAKFPGQRFNLEHELKDKDVVQIHLR